MLDWRINNQIEDVIPFNSMNWKLTNGIARDSDLTDIKRILGDKLMGDGKDGSNYYYLNDRARVDLEYYRRKSDGGSEDSLKLMGLVVRLKEG